MSDDANNYEAIRAAILAWWDEHKQDTVAVPDGEYWEEYNIYNEPPLFVRMALRGNEIGERALKEIGEIIKRGAN